MKLAELNPQTRHHPLRQVSAMSIFWTRLSRHSLMILLGHRCLYPVCITNRSFVSDLPYGRYLFNFSYQQLPGFKASLCQAAATATDWSPSCVLTKFPRHKCKQLHRIWSMFCYFNLFCSPTCYVIPYKYHIMPQRVAVPNRNRTAGPA